MAMNYDNTFLLGLYRTMIRIRFCEESLVDPILSGAIRTPCHLYSGQEAIASGVCATLNETDFIFGNHRSHGHFLAKGGSMKEMVAEIFARETGCSRGRGGSMHLIDPAKGMMGSAPIVAGTISLAVGASLAISIQESDRVAVSFFGDGATGEGVLYESLNFAALNKLPIVFVCENNFYATHMPICDCRVESHIYSVAKPFCVESSQVDGNDVLAVYEAAEKVVDACRRGNGPVFLECLTYRQRGHVGPDDNIQGCHTDIRPKEEIEEWLARDPIKLFEEYLSDLEYSDISVLAGIRKEVQSEVEAAHQFALESPYPEVKDIGRFVFA
jgi:pyruvate dehydrogenase E1 component alpha subunit